MLLLCSIVMPYSVFAHPPQNLGTSSNQSSDESWSVQDQSNGESIFFEDYKKSEKKYNGKVGKKIATGLLMVPIAATGGYCALTYTSLLWIGTFFQGMNGIGNEFSAKKYFNFNQVLKYAKKIVYASLSEEQQDQIDKEFNYPFEKIVIQDLSLSQTIREQRIKLRQQKTKAILESFLLELKSQYPNEINDMSIEELKSKISFLTINGNFSEVLDTIEEQKNLEPFKKAIISEIINPTQGIDIADQDFTAQTYEKYTLRAERFQKQVRNKKVQIAILVPSLAGGIAASVASAGILSFVPVIEAIAGVQTVSQLVKKKHIYKAMKTVMQLMVASLDPQQSDEFLSSITDVVKKQIFIEKAHIKLKDIFAQLQIENPEKALDIEVMKLAIIKLARNGRLLKIRKVLEVSTKLDILKDELLAEMESLAQQSSEIEENITSDRTIDPPMRAPIAVDNLLSSRLLVSEV